MSRKSNVGAGCVRSGVNELGKIIGPYPFSDFVASMAPKKSGGKGRWWGSPFASSSKKLPAVATQSSDTSVETDPSEDVSVGGPAENSYVPEITSAQTSESRRTSNSGRRHSVSTGGSREDAYGLVNQAVEPRSLAEMRRSVSIGGSRRDMYGLSDQINEPRRASVSERRRGTTSGENPNLEPGRASTSRRRRGTSPAIPSPPSIIYISSDSSRGQVDQGEDAPGEPNDSVMQSPHVSESFHASESYDTSESTDSYYTLSTESSMQYTSSTQSTWENPYAIPAESSHLTHVSPVYDHEARMGSPAQIAEPELPSPISYEDPMEIAALLAPLYDNQEELASDVNRLIYKTTPNYLEGNINEEQGAQTMFGTQSNYRNEDNNEEQDDEGNPIPFEGLSNYEEGESSRPRAANPDADSEFSLSGYSTYGGLGPLIRQTARKSVRPPPRRTPSPRPPSPPPAAPAVMVRCHLCGEARYHSPFCPYVINYAGTGPEDILCFMCGARGHYSTTCPMNPGNRQAPPPAPPSTSSGRRSSNRQGPRN